VIRFFGPKSNYTNSPKLYKSFHCYCLFFFSFFPLKWPIFFLRKGTTICPIKIFETKLHCFFFLGQFPIHGLPHNIDIVKFCKHSIRPQSKPSNYETLLQKLKHDLINSSPPPMDKHLEKNNEPTTESTPKFTS